MKIRRVYIKNLNSLRGDWTIDFEVPPLSQTGIFAITGPTGAGKTTVLDAITLALYGALARSKDVKEVLSYGTTACQAEVEFWAGEERYLASWRIYRARGKQDGNLIGPKRELARWDAKQESFAIIAEKIREVDEAVETVSGLDYHRFTRSVLLSQGDFAAFLKADERERSELLERITGTEIYSDISKAAFTRAKIEQQKLEQLQEQLANLGLLTEEPINPEELVSLRAETQTAQQKLQATRQQVQTAERYQEAVAQLQTLEVAAKELRQRQEAFTDQQKKLDSLKALRPHYKNLDEWQRLNETLTQQREEIAKLQTNQATLSKTLVAQTTEREQAETHLQNMRKQTKQDRVKWEKAALLLQSQSQESQQQAAYQERVEQMRQDCDAWRMALQNTQHELAKQQTTLTELTNWLSANSADAMLNERLVAVEGQRERLAEIYREREQQLADKARLDKEILAQRSQLADLTQELERRHQSSSQQADALRQALPVNFDLSGEEAIARLQEEIRYLDVRARELIQLRELDEQYRQVLQEQETYQVRLQSLLTDQEQLTKAILSKVEEQDAFQPTVEFKRNIYQQQQLIANYTKDRQALKEGEPCPLCGSTEHPFHEENLVPFEDEALAEYEHAQKYYEALQREERQLLQRENEIAQEITLLTGQDLAQISGRLAQQQARMETFEAKIAGLITADKAWSNKLRGDRLDQQIQQINTQLNTWQTAEQLVVKLNKQLQAHTQATQELDKALTAAQARLEAREAEVERLQKQLAATELRYTDAIQLMNEQLVPLGHQFDLNTARQVFAELRTRAKVYQTKEEQATSANQQVQLLSSKAEQLVPQLAKREEELTTQEAQLAQLKTKLEALNQQLEAILQGQNLEVLRKATETVFKQAETQRQTVEESWQVLQRQVATTTQRLQDRETTVTNLEATQAQLTKSLVAVLQSLGYTTIAKAQAERLTPTEEEALLTEAQAIRLAVAEQQAAQAAAHAQREKWLAGADLVLPQLQTTLSEQDNIYQKLLRQLGQLEEKQRQAEKRAQQHASLLDTIEKQRQEFNRWAQLNELIGQADGKKFRTFAQGLTLQKLVALANLHLERLNGRYVIHKRTEADLELDIVDTFQADNRRSMYTLSGGESFLVSLALALGLSDLAGKHAQINSLFIDEGFGTLDEHSLDLALDTLENLQSKGKTIGIISHVKALKERIGVQIQIQKHSNGFSDLRVM